METTELVSVDVIIDTIERCLAGLIRDTINKKVEMLKL